MANPWFRFYSEFEDDPKVQMMSEADQRRLVMLFCQRCKGQKRTDAQQSFKWRVSLDEVARTKAVFIEMGFIDKDWNLLNWDKRQFLSDNSTDRTRRYRERVRTSQERHSDGHVTDSVTKCDGLEQIQNRTETEHKKPEPSAFVVPDWIDKDAWQGFEEMRKKIKAPLTDRARQGIMNELRTIGGPAAAILDQSTRNCWKGVFPLKTNGKAELELKPKLQFIREDGSMVVAQ